MDGGWVSVPYINYLVRKFIIVPYNQRIGWYILSNLAHVSIINIFIGPGKI